MALQAQYKNPTKGSNCYRVRGTADEIQDFIASQGQYLVLDDDGSPLFFSKTVLPGQPDDWHPLVKSTGGARKGQYSLETRTLRFQEAQVESIRSSVLQDKVATTIAQSNYSATVRAATQNVLSLISTPAEPEPEPETEPEVIQADPTADITDAAKGAPKTNK